MQITIDEYARRYKMSKEMIHAKIRAGRLEHSVVDGTVRITVPDEAVREEPVRPASAERSRTTAGAIIMMYQKENAQLKERVRELEAKIDRLIGDKERMLREERDRIETIYAKRDEQLKSFLELINARLLSESPSAPHAVEDTDAIPADPLVQENDPENETPPGRRIELKKYLTVLDYTPRERKQIKKRFAKAYGNDVRVMQENGEFVLDFLKYDYSDLLAR